MIIIIIIMIIILMNTIMIIIKKITARSPIKKNLPLLATYNPLRKTSISASSADARKQYTSRLVLLCSVLTLKRMSLRVLFPFDSFFQGFLVSLQKRENFHCFFCLWFYCVVIITFARVINAAWMFSLR